MREYEPALGPLATFRTAPGYNFRTAERNRHGLRAYTWYSTERVPHDKWP